jgi:cysteine-rich repeat protein
VLGASGNNILVKRFLTDGTPDTTFATSGTYTAGGFSGNTIAVLTTIAYQDPGRILIGGAFITATGLHQIFLSSDAIVARLIDDGHTLDIATSFNLGSTTDFVHDLAPIPDGRIVGAAEENDLFTVFRFETAVCGDGAIAGGETCDDGNTSDGDGCDHNCQPTGCGNGVITTGETCDDANTADGDCCSSTCQLDAAGTACGDDGDVCTNDVCNASGGCTHPNNTAPCDDGNPCTTLDTCGGGQCVGYAISCPLCQVCETTGGTCVDGPRPACRALPAGASATLQIRDKTPDKGDALQWKRAKAVDTPPSDFGDPLGPTQYGLCLYDESSPTPSLLAELAARQGTCGAKSCWKNLGLSGWKYHDKELTPDGLASMLLKGSLGGPSTIAMKARGTNLPGPTLPLPLPARVQLQATNGACWEATYSAIGVKRNDASQFKGTND